MYSLINFYICLSIHIIPTQIKLQNIYSTLIGSYMLHSSSCSLEDTYSSDFYNYSYLTAFEVYINKIS